jgi:hypothetical protein
VLHTDEDTTTAKVGEEIPIKAGVNLFVLRRIKTDDIYSKRDNSVLILWWGTIESRRMSPCREIWIKKTSKGKWLRETSQRLLYTLSSSLYKSLYEVNWTFSVDYQKRIENTFYLTVQKVAITTCIWRRMLGWQWRMNWTVCWRKSSWSSWRYYPDIFLRHWESLQRIAVRVVRLWPKFQPTASNINDNFHRLKHFYQFSE